jgi:hypothetical protein
MESIIKLEDNHSQDYLPIKDRTTGKPAILTGTYVKIWNAIAIYNKYYPQAIMKETGLDCRQTVYKYLKIMEKNQIITKINPEDVELGKIIVPNELQDSLKEKGYNKSLTVYTTKYKVIKQTQDVTQIDKKEMQNRYEPLPKSDMPYYLTIIFTTVILLLNIPVIVIINPEIARIITTIISGGVIAYNYINRKIFQ